MDSHGSIAIKQEFYVKTYANGTCVSYKSFVSSTARITTYIHTHTHTHTLRHRKSVTNVSTSLEQVVFKTDETDQTRIRK